MAKFNFEVARENKRKHSSRGKTFRVIMLFCLVAAVTAAVIYAVIPKAPPAPENEKKTSTAAAGTSEEKKSDAGIGKSTENTVNTGNASEKNNDAASNGNGSISETNAAAGASEEKKSNADTTAERSISGNTAKFDPSRQELWKLTDSLKKDLAGNLWKNGKDITIHRVASGDSLERIARKYHTTLQFLQRFNRISNPNTIRIGQKIYCFTADGWEIIISRKDQTLQLNRVIKGNSVAFALFPCQFTGSDLRDDLVICRRFSEPFLVDNQGRRFSPETPENPFGEGQLTLARAAAPGNRLAFSIHGKGGSTQAQADSLRRGSIALDNQDIKLLYCLVPEKTPVKIVK